MDLVISHALSPAKIGDRVVDALLTCVALRFHGITSQSTGSCRAITRAHEDWICSMAKMISPGVFPSSRSFRVRFGGRWETEARGSQCFSGRFKSDGWDPKGRTQ